MPPTSLNDFGKEEKNPYQIYSRKEILQLLNAIKERQQLVRMIIGGGAHVVVTSILDIDLNDNVVVVDCAHSQIVNQHFLNAEKITFETTLDRIGIVFSVAAAEACMYEERPALLIEIPASLVRMQRREFYRVSTPIATPLHCTLPLPPELGTGIAVLPLVDISCGGLALMDERKMLDVAVGRVYKNCRIDLHGVGVALATLEVRYSQEVTLLNNKPSRRIGCAFVNLPKSTLTSVQRYIMKLERERNAKEAGLA
ncbi:MAG: flagellar brake protein [Pseudomonadota bacterium]